MAWGMHDLEVQAVDLEPVDLLPRFGRSGLAGLAPDLAEGSLVPASRPQARGLDAQRRRFPGAITVFLSQRPSSGRQGAAQTVRPREFWDGSIGSAAGRWGLVRSSGGAMAAGAGA